MVATLRFARILDALRRPFLRHVSRDRSSAPIHLERLEERCVTAVLSSDLPGWDTSHGEPTGGALLADVWPFVAIELPIADDSAISVAPSVTPTEPGLSDATFDGYFTADNSTDWGPPLESGVVTPLTITNVRHSTAPDSFASSSSPAPATTAPASDFAGIVSLQNPAAHPSLSVQSIAVASRDPTPDAFRLLRAPVADTRLEVPYTLTAFTPAGRTSVDRLAVFAPGVATLQITPFAPLAGTGGTTPEVITLTLTADAAYRLERPSATLFVTGDPHACSDAALLAAYHEARSEAALTALLQRNEAMVRQTCYRVLGNWHDAEDVSQFVFLMLARGQMRFQATLAGWLRTVARNAAIMLLRARQRRLRHEQETARPVESLPGNSVDELREELDIALAQMATPLREAVRLRYLEGCSQTEAAARIGCPRGTLSQRAALGLQRLGEILRRRNTLTE